MLPNAFSPNQDGVNDVFRIPPDNNIMEVKVFQVFNRWGDLIWKGSTSDAAWDGTRSGTPLNNGTYFYYLEAVCGQTGDIKQVKGYVTLIR